MSFKKAFSFFLVLIIFVAQLKAQQQKINSFYFDTDKSVLEIQQETLIKQFISELDTTKIKEIEILGYCDDVGRKGYNDTLSYKRAAYVQQLLLAKGIDPSAIVMLTGKGKITLKDKKDVYAERANNRRVDIIIKYLPPVPIAKANEIFSDTLKVGDKIILENVLFENSRHQILEQSIPVVERLADVLLAKKKYSIAILGHICCNPPGVDVIDFDTGERNLSEARAKIIYDYLIYRGIEKKRLSYKGMMANYPLGKGDRYDRRVELQIVAIAEQ
ncbi:OmpA family protein [Pedobacter sp.]|uniref:OmpA family protein n=1 Tax=Pedobacter sp. TaxID=1411316 RepID=UPI00396CA1CC